MLTLISAGLHYYSLTFIIDNIRSYTYVHHEHVVKKFFLLKNLLYKQPRCGQSFSKLIRGVNKETKYLKVYTWKTKSNILKNAAVIINLKPNTVWAYVEYKTTLCVTLLTYVTLKDGTRNF